MWCYEPLSTLCRGQFLSISVNYNCQFAFIHCLITIVVIGQRWSQSLSAGTGIMNINDLGWLSGSELETGLKEYFIIVQFH